MESSNDGSCSPKDIIHKETSKKDFIKESRTFKENDKLKDRNKSPDLTKETTKEQKENTKDERAKLRVERSGHQNARVKL